MPLDNARLHLEIDLTKFPQFATVPHEPATVLREAADWLEKRFPHGEYEETTRRTLRNFESEPAGYIQIRGAAHATR